MSTSTFVSESESEREQERVRASEKNVFRTFADASPLSAVGNHRAIKFKSLAIPRDLTAD